jgi:hypothetical protein
MTLRRFTKPILIKGQPTILDCLEIHGQTYAYTPGPATILALEEEWYEDVKDPATVIASLKGAGDHKPDIFTFWQRLPDLQPRYDYLMEWESIAVLPIQSYDHWFSKQISSRFRGQIRKAKREGLEVRKSEYDDEFVRGMTQIFNEISIRQGRKFWHYGKDFATVKQQFSTYLFREDLIGAYIRSEMVGFMMLANTGKHALIGQIISMIKHRDKSPNNALIAKAVEICECKGLQYLVYLYWTNDSLSEFKRRCGFQETKVPRFFVPLTVRGHAILKLGLHRGWSAAMPHRIKSPLKKVRRYLYELNPFSRK